MVNRSFDVVGLGNAIVDVIAKVPENFLDEWEIRKNGMTLIDEERAVELTQAVQGQELSGGSGANTIVGVSSFGGSAAYIGKVADDRLGQIFVDDIHAANVAFDTSPLRSGIATARSIILVTPDGSRSMNTYLGASVLFSPDDVDADLVTSCDILYLEGYLYDREAAKGAFVEVADLALSAGKKTALTLSDGFCVDRHRPSFLDFIQLHTSLLFANEAELVALYESDNFEDALDQVGRDVPVAAVTRGERGSVVVKGKEQIHVPATHVEKVVDTTGAGDQYAAGFLFGYVRGCELIDCARLGHIAAAEVISHYGPRPEQSYANLVKRNGLERVYSGA